MLFVIYFLVFTNATQISHAAFLSHLKKSLSRHHTASFFLSKNLFSTHRFHQAVYWAKVRRLKYQISRHKTTTAQHCIRITKLLYMTQESWLHNVEEAQTGHKSRKCGIKLKLDKVRPASSVRRKWQITVRKHDPKYDPGPRNPSNNNNPITKPKEKTRLFWQAAGVLSSSHQWGRT